MPVHTGSSSTEDGDAVQYRYRTLYGKGTIVLYMYLTAKSRARVSIFCSRRYVFWTRRLQRIARDWLDLSCCKLRVRSVSLSIHFLL